MRLPTTVMLAMGQREGAACAGLAGAWANPTAQASIRNMRHLLASE